MLPLDGVTVVSMEHAVSAPFATRQLADLGARVIKIERPGVGDFARNYDETVHRESSSLVWLNRSKETLTLDVKSPDGLAIVHELLAGADVFLNNLGPGAVERLGLDAVTLVEAYPRLIHATISGYGTSGDWAHRKAYDLLVQSEAGLVSITGEPDSVARVEISLADIAAGMYAYSGILTALLHRANTGTAAPVEVSLFEALAEWMGNPAYCNDARRHPPQRVGTQHASIAPYGPFTSARGRHRHTVGAEPARVGRVLRDGHGRLDADGPRGVRDELRALRQSVGPKRHDRPAVRRAGDRRCHRSARPGQDRERSGQRDRRLVDHPALASRDRWVTVDSPSGEIRALKPPATLGGIEPRMDAVPALGARTPTPSSLHLATLPSPSQPSGPPEPSDPRRKNHVAAEQ